jgi:hypothetical protein
VLRDDDKPLEEREFPDGSGLDADGDDVELVRCPSCGRMIYEEAPQCPYCRWWITDDDASAAGGIPGAARGIACPARGIAARWWFWAAVGAIVAIIAWEVLL